jgi:hypothetical protein
LAELSVCTLLEVLAPASSAQLVALLNAAGSVYVRKVRRTLASMLEAVRDLHVALSLVDGTVESAEGLALARALGG